MHDRRALELTREPPFLEQTFASSHRS